MRLLLGQLVLSVHAREAFGGNTRFRDSNNLVFPKLYSYLEPCLLDNKKEDLELALSAY